MSLIIGALSLSHDRNQCHVHPGVPCFHRPFISHRTMMEGSGYVTSGSVPLHRSPDEHPTDGGRVRGGFKFLHRLLSEHQSIPPADEAGGELKIRWVCHRTTTAGERRPNSRRRAWGPGQNRFGMPACIVHAWLVQSRKDKNTTTVTVMRVRRERKRLDILLPGPSLSSPHDVARSPSLHDSSPPDCFHFCAMAMSPDRPLAFWSSAGKM